MLTVPDADARYVDVDGSGGWGSGREDAVADAVLLLRTAGRPGRVEWMRVDTGRHGERA